MNNKYVIAAATIVGIVIGTTLITYSNFNLPAAFGDLVFYSPNSVTFKPGDAVDINVQRSLGSIGEFYEGDEQLPLDLTGNNPVIDLNEEHDAQDANVQQIVGNLEQLKADDVINLLFELANGNNQVFNLDEEHDNDNDNDNDNDEDEEENDNEEDSNEEEGEDE